MSIHVIARAVICLDNHVLFAYDPRKQPAHYYQLNASFYYLPGGHVEFKETAAAAAIREVAEETGHIGVIEHYLGSVEHAWSFAGDERCCHTHEMNVVFKVAIPELTAVQPIAQREEHVAFSWTPYTRLSEYDIRPALLKTLIPEWIQGKNLGSFSSILPNQAL